MIYGGKTIPDRRVVLRLSYRINPADSASNPRIVRRSPDDGGMFTGTWRMVWDGAGRLEFDTDDIREGEGTMVTGRFRRLAPGTSGNSSLPDWIGDLTFGTDTGMLFATATLSRSACID